MRRTIGIAMTWAAALGTVPSCGSETGGTASPQQQLTTSKGQLCTSMCDTLFRCHLRCACEDESCDCSSPSAQPQPGCAAGCEAYVDEGIADAPECSDETLAWLRCFQGPSCTFSPTCSESEDTMEECRMGAIDPPGGFDPVADAG